MHRYYDPGSAGWNVSAPSFVPGARPVNDDVGGLLRMGIVRSVHSGTATEESSVLEAVARWHERGVPAGDCRAVVTLRAAKWACGFHRRWVQGQPLFSIDPIVEADEVAAVRRRGKIAEGDVPEPSLLASPPQLTALLREASKYVASLSARFDAGRIDDARSARLYARRMAMPGGMVPIPDVPSRRERPFAPPSLPGFPLAIPPLLTIPSLAMPAPLPSLFPTMPRPPSALAPAPAPAPSSSGGGGGGGTPARRPGAMVRSAPSGLELLRRQRSRAAAGPPAAAAAAAEEERASRRRPPPTEAPSRTEGPVCFSVLREGNDATEKTGDDIERDDWRAFGATVLTTSEEEWGGRERWNKIASLRKGISRYANAAQLRRCVRFVGTFLAEEQTREEEDHVKIRVIVSGVVECAPYWGDRLAPGDVVGFVVARLRAELDPTLPYILRPWSSRVRSCPTREELSFVDSSGATCIGTYARVGIVIRTVGGKGNGDSDFTVSDRRRRDGSDGDGDGVEYPRDYGLYGLHKGDDVVRTDAAYDQTRHAARTVVLLLDPSPMRPSVVLRE